MEMTSRTEGFRCELTKLLLRLTVLLGNEVCKPNTVNAAKNYSVNIVVDFMTLTVGDRSQKALNISCFFDHGISSVSYLGLNRWLTGDSFHEDYLLQASPEVDGGLVKALPRSGPEVSKSTHVQGSVQERWLHLVLSNVTSADTGDYTCLMVYVVAGDAFESKATTLFVIVDNEEDVEIAAEIERKENSWWDGNGYEAVKITMIVVYSMIGVAIVGHVIVKRRRQAGPSLALASAEATQSVVARDEAGATEEFGVQRDSVRAPAAAVASPSQPNEPEPVLLSRPAEDVLAPSTAQDVRARLPEDGIETSTIV